MDLELRQSIEDKTNRIPFLNYTKDADTWRWFTRGFPHSSDQGTLPFWQGYTKTLTLFSKAGKPSRFPEKSMSKDECNPNRDQRYKIIVWGLLVHLLLLFAVFDIYFASPLDQGMTSVRSTSSPPAKRLVLIVADGLRADAVIGESKAYRIPFLSKIRESGTWGVVHTRVPTESRPGHVAMMAGIYEDPSAIFKGWKTNLVDFDSVIAQSTNAWCWGSPGVVDLFSKDNLSTIHNYTYSLELEDFGKSHTGILDIWVYHEVNQFLEDVSECRDSDCDRYFSRGNFFFMHLLGIDTAGHGYKPYSKEYIDNIKLVDDIARNLTALFEDTFEDKSTTFVFTSDHGMTDWGSHGAGSLHETEVPIFAWGAGVAANKHRQDINQIDIAPLLASLIGVNIPVNSLGILPVNYLNISKSDKAELMLSNVLQLLKIFDVKRLRTETNALVFLPFRGITDDFIETKLNSLRKLKHKVKFEEFLTECTKFMRLLIEGVTYYHNYYQYPILISVSVGFLGWILLLLQSVFLCDKQTVYVLLLEHGYISSDSSIKYISWLFIIVPILMIPLTSTFIAPRLVATFLGFAPFYLLVSPNFEVLFSVFYVALLCSWLLIESKSFQFGTTLPTHIVYYVKFEGYNSKNKINSDMFRRAFLFTVFIFVGFFGTGNVASLNTFDPILRI
ncbi:hypothetical protein NQ318_004137 [Aromia moschata]|uniref:GPI ethanolamine phosphate transferase 1 n=1 Tax=Aromia moschata TaxID=1265417 RepID=A0AAV8YL68_9CUCU|nr:hypothetical protein NQ318_004137 [Aromia moschata]